MFSVWPNPQRMAKDPEAIAAAVRMDSHDHRQQGGTSVPEPLRQSGGACSEAPPKPTTEELWKGTAWCHHLFSFGQDSWPRIDPTQI